MGSVSSTGWPCLGLGSRLPTSSGKGTLLPWEVLVLEPGR